MRKIRTIAVAIGMLGILLALAMATAAIPGGSQQQQKQQDETDKSAIGKAGISSNTFPNLRKAFDIRSIYSVSRRVV